MIESLSEYLREWLTDAGLNDTVVTIIFKAFVIVAIVVVSVLADLVSRWLLRSLTGVIRRSETKWDDALLERKVFNRLSHIAPAIVVYYAAQYGLADESLLEPLVTTAAAIYMIAIGTLAIDAFLTAVVDIYRTYDVSARRPIKGYVQVAKIVVYCVAVVMALSTILGRDPMIFLGGLGAFTAVLMLIFKDSILGLVAGIQLTRYDMIRIGDWIEMPKYGADGDVIDVSLNTVKVRNWDKTITTIPAYALVSDSFKNWRGMNESGGRRIKRALYIDMSSIKLCTDEMLDRFERFSLIADYVRQKRREVTDYNAQRQFDTSELINGRRLTNVGTFRAYVEAYLRDHPKVHQNMTFLVRQLQPTENGLPLEIYVFSNDQVWAHYEGIQSDIFDHLLAVVPQFDLRVFQTPTGGDFAGLVSSAVSS